MFKFENERQEGIKCVNIYCEFCKDEPDIICDAVNGGGDPSYSDCLSYLPEKLIAVESQKTPTNSARDAITPLVVRAVTTDGSHHKQWYLEAIAEAFQIELPPHDLGIAP